MKTTYYLISLVTVTLLISSCCKAIFETETKVNNSTTETLEIRFFSSGKYESQLLEAKMQNIPTRTIINSPYDSVLVIVRGSLSQVHLRSPTIATPRNSRDILYNDSKNLFNPANYVINEENLACDGKRTQEIYTFK